MKKATYYLVFVLLFFGCDNSKWETIYGDGISDEPKSIEEAIYFEDENNGIVGGYTLIEDSAAQNDFKLSQIPTLYLTADGGKNWLQIHFDSTLKQSIRNAYLHLDTLICRTDSFVLFSINRGNSFIYYKDSIKRKIIAEKYLNDNKAEIKIEDFQYKDTKYTIKELFQNDFASVIVCYGPEVQVNYYFVSFDKGQKWNFLQKAYGDNRQRFLLRDQFLYCYHFPLGLQRLRLQ